MYSTFSHCSQETFSTENVLTGRGPHRRLEHLLTDGAVEIVFRVGRGLRELLGHGEVWAGETTAPARAEVAEAALSRTPRESPQTSRALPPRLTLRLRHGPAERWLRSRDAQAFVGLGRSEARGAR